MFVYQRVTYLTSWYDQILQILQILPGQEEAWKSSPQRPRSDAIGSQCQWSWDQGCPSGPKDSGAGGFSRTRSERGHRGGGFRPFNLMCFDAFWCFFCIFLILWSGVKGVAFQARIILLMHTYVWLEAVLHSGFSWFFSGIEGGDCDTLSFVPFLVFIELCCAYLSCLVRVVSTATGFHPISQGVGRDDATKGTAAGWCF